MSVSNLKSNVIQDLKCLEHQQDGKFHIKHYITSLFHFILCAGVMWDALL